MGLLDFFHAGKIKRENEALKNKLYELHADDYFQVKEHIDIINMEISQKEPVLIQLKENIAAFEDKSQKLEKQINTQQNRIKRCKELYASIEHCIENFLETDVPYQHCKLSRQDFEEVDLISPSIILKLHCMDMKDLRQEYRKNEKQINTLLEQYSKRYTTKANKSIYNLMVIALRAELQNVLYNLKYEKLDQAVDHMKGIFAKYLKIAAEGNQSIAGTMTKFIGEMEYLFINAVKIEYNYYVKKEQARQEQLAIKEQMRQEAAERKALEAERKKIEKEESKYTAEIKKIENSLAEVSNESEIQQRKKRLVELQCMLSDVIVKKSEIMELQNGKAGNVYIISNLGSFGEHVFKIGMTRRLNPQDRVNELGDASVPFRFDVHSFIFSDDAVGLEKELHQRLNSKRVNKVNMRKEFFYTSIDELEKMVTDIDPTAEFNKTMLAEEYHQSLSSDEPYTSDFSLPDDAEDEE